MCSQLAALSAAPTPIISLAKREEEIFLPGQSRSLRLPENHEARKLLQSIRDEAHRFAITYHRRLRQKSQTQSFLDDAPQIGVKRRQALLKAFGSLKQIRAASVEELSAVPGMNEKAAAALFDYLHKRQENDGNETKWKAETETVCYTNEGDRG